MSALKRGTWCIKRTPKWEVVNLGLLLIGCNTERQVAPKSCSTQRQVANNFYDLFGPDKLVMLWDKQ